MRPLSELRDAHRKALRSDGKQTAAGTPLDVRLFGNTITVGECWEYQGARNERTGHGRIADTRGRIRGAHRIAHQLIHGNIGDGRCVLHSCDNPPCVNPAHLWLGSYTENNHDRDAKGRTRNQHTGPMSTDERQGRTSGIADALHLGGNGLVPLAACHAFRQLVERLGQ